MKRASLKVVKYLVWRFPEALKELDNKGKTPLSLALFVLHSWIKSYMTIRCVRVGEHFLLRSLVANQRATQKDLIVEKDERDLLNFLYQTSPDGIFGLIMSYL
jgi:hypothetical protein